MSFSLQIKDNYNENSLLPVEDGICGKLIVFFNVYFIAETQSRKDFNEGWQFLAALFLNMVLCTRSSL